MTERDLTALVEHEQGELVALLVGLDGAQWESPSLCDGWSVHDVAVHLAIHVHRSGWAALRGTPKTMARDMAARSDIDRQALIDWVGQPVTASNLDVQLGELLIHQQDIRRPLGLPRRPEPDAVVEVLDYMGTRMGSVAVVQGARKRRRGLRLVATDLGWSVGEGPEVRGEGEAVLMALSGRTTALDDLDGPGLEVLSGRTPDAAPAQK